MSIALLLKLAPAPEKTIWRRVEPEAPPTQTRPQRQDDSGWFTRVRKRVKLALAGDEEELLVTNETAVSWHIYHKYHLLGILDPWEARTFHLRKHGNLNARPHLESDVSEYLVIDLHARIQRVEIYRRQFGQSMDVYDMRAA
jgi:hypothetical protein